MSSKVKSPVLVFGGNICDNVSVVLYHRREEDNAIKIALLKEDNIFSLPRKELATKESRGEPVASVSSDENAYPEGDAASSLATFWPRDVYYSKAAANLAREVSSMESSETIDPRLIQLTRMYIPSLKRHYHHAVFATCVKSNVMEDMAKKEDMKILTVDEISRMHLHKFERMNIIMLAEYIKLQMGHDSEHVGTMINEYGPNLLWRQVSEEKMSSDDFLLRSPGYCEQDVEILFEEFVRYSYPHSTVKLSNIKSLFTDLGFKNREAHLFRAIDRQRSGELSYKEFILGLAALDPLTSHGNKPAQIRCRYIFRFYNLEADDYMKPSEVKELVKDISLLQSLEVTSEAITAKTKKAYEIFQISDKENLPLNNFLCAVGSLKFRGTSGLLRANTPIIQHFINKLGRSISQRRSASSAFRSPESSEFLHKKLRKSGVHCENNGTNKPENMDVDLPTKSSSSCSPGSIPVSQDSSSYTLAQHTVKVRRSGQVTDIHLLLDMERAGEVCDTGLDVDDAMSVDSTGVPHFRRGSNLIPGNGDYARNRLFDRFQSVEAFNTKSLPNEMITALRFFEHSNSNKPHFDWGEVDMVKLGNYIVNLCSATKELMENEPRLLWISTPCYILGDIHGNFQDLVCFEKALWRVGPHLTPANFLFLGDYVDRGDYGVEVISYLFAQKLQAPQSFFLLRGNHELRDIQQMFTFHKECLKKFGDRLGMVVWNAINDVFDRMPIAAVVDKKIFCIHGGIPKIENDGGLKDLEKIPCPLPNPETESNVAWQMMWNDPVSAEEMKEEVQQELQANHGFAYNEKRQTAYVFNQAAFDSFVKCNGLTHVVRAHEVKQAGFEIQQSGRLMTVFSSSHYCGGSNEAACILVHNYRMRIIRIDTS
ncbi:hypothetical protein SK128_026880 [Halocaridina rubra]|uniref:Serine/threonine-protein phosphatase n=1 Tax=Halocaridina rubra TaxID=373956 RepID=A0AAN8XQL6_HALRR